MSTPKTFQGRIVWGLILILVGVLFLFDQMGRLDFGEIVARWWPAVFILIGLSILIGNRFRDAGGGVFFILFGAFFLLMRLRIFDHTAWHYFWPLIIVACGLWLILKPTFAGARKKAFEGGGDDLRISAVLSGIQRRIESPSFRGGKAEAILGGLDLDLTRAALAEGRATLELTAVMGGIDVRVPRDWQVVLDATPILGGIDDQTHPLPEAERKGVLYVKATAILGGIDIKD
jgi:predicted membrane protein